MTAPRCPTCKADLSDRPPSDAHPFCGPRCKLADLGNWFDGRYAIADSTPSLEPESISEDDPRVQALMEELIARSGGRFHE
jgi:hypothetical protein